MYHVWWFKILPVDTHRIQQVQFKQVNLFANIQFPKYLFSQIWCYFPICWDSIWIDCECLILVTDSIKAVVYHTCTLYISGFACLHCVAICMSWVIRCITGILDCLLRGSIKLTFTFCVQSWSCWYNLLMLLQRQLIIICELLCDHISLL